jgi:TRADD-N domain-containing protein
MTILDEAPVLIDGSPTTDAHRNACSELGHAIDAGKMGEIVAKHEHLILAYYKDVQRQANKSFDTARTVAQWGFYVLICTLIYTLVIDGISRITQAPQDARNLMTVATIGGVSGALMEFIAGITFWLYARGARQFGAFHICLERTHRYLLAFKITEEMKEKDPTLHNLVCIMANAPMITRGDIESDLSRDITRLVQPAPMTPSSVPIAPASVANAPAG